VRRIFQIALVVLAASLSFAQLNPQPITTNQAGVPTSALVTVCATNPGIGSCGSLVATYTNSANTTACTGTLTALNNTINPTTGSGCSNPGYSDAQGNVVAYAAAGQYFCQYSGATIQPVTRPCSAGGGSSSGGSGFSLTFSQAGMTSGDATDNTAALNTALSTLFTAGGGTLICDKPGTYLFNSAQITIPNDGGTWPDNGGLVPANKPIRITGGGGTPGVLTNDSFSSGFTAATNGGCILDLRYNATTAKLITLGQGQLEIDHLTLLDNGSDCAPFILTTNTSLSFHDNSLQGTQASNYSTPIYSCNDGILLGTSAITSNGTTSAIFQGYNTKIQHNFFDKLLRAVFAQNWTNGVTISDNVSWINSGSSSHGAIEFVCVSTNTCEGNWIANNLIEMKNLAYGVNFPGFYAVRNFLYNNSCYDGSPGPFLKCVNDQSRQNEIVGGYVGFTASAQYAAEGTGTVTNGNYFFARGDTSLGHEVGILDTEDSTGIGGWAYWGSGNLRGWVGTCGASCSPATSPPTTPANLASNMFVWANTGDVVAYSHAGNGLVVYSADHSTPDFKVTAAGNTVATGSLSAGSYLTATNCSSSASPAVCGSAAAGSVALPTGATPTLQVNTTAVTANSQILLQIDETLGTKLSVTCNTTLSTLLNPVVTARSAGASFTFTINSTLAINPACISYSIVN
jgi:hypothetical protein